MTTPEFEKGDHVVFKVPQWLRKEFPDACYQGVVVRDMKLREADVIRVEIVDDARGSEPSRSRIVSAGKRDLSHFVPRP